MSIKIQFSDKKREGIDICAENMCSYFAASFLIIPQGVRKVASKPNKSKMPKSISNMININSRLEVWDFLTKNSLESSNFEGLSKTAKGFRAKVIKALWKFTNENRDVFYGK